MIEQGRQLARNIATSWAGYGLRAVISLFFVPFITAVLGDARYGVWVIVFQTINYFVLLDFGLEKALLRFISRHLSQRQFDTINRILNTAFGLYLLLGAAIIAGTWLTATFLFGLVKVDDPGLIAEGAAALKIVGIYMGLRFFFMPFAGSLGGFQRFDIGNGLQMIEDFLRTGIMVWLLYQGYGLAALAWTIVGVSLARQIAAFVVLRRLHREVRVRPADFNKQQARELFRYSKITFGITATWLVIFNTDTVLLGLLASAATAGVYAPGAMLMLYFRHIVNAVATPLTTTISHYEAAGDWDQIRSLYLRGLRYTSYVAFAVAAGVALYARPFVHLWLEPEFFEAAEVMRILAVGSAFFVPQIIGNAVLFGTDKHRYLLRVTALEAAAKLALSIILIIPYGLTGMAWAAALPQIMIYVTLYPWYMSQVLDIPMPTIMLNALRSGAVALFATVPIEVIMRTAMAPDSWFTFLADIGVVILAVIAAGWLIVAKEDKQRIRALLRRSGR
ncbi:oligosaccharide flippase family protein [candidate division GN15 bacterium]|nr:oligosaccharide flippase family protein [candidate division GN15 bacterium]